MRLNPIAYAVRGILWPRPPQWKPIDEVVRWRRTLLSLGSFWR